MIVFKTHTGAIVSQIELKKACESVAEDWRNNAYACHKGTDYPKHVSQQVKDELLEKALVTAIAIERQENLHNFTIWQRVNTKITGECVAFLSK